MQLHPKLRQRLFTGFVVLGALVAIAFYGGYRNLRSAIEASMEEHTEHRISHIGRELVTTHRLYLERCRAAMRVLRDATAQLGEPSRGGTVKLDEREVSDLRFGRRSVAQDFEIVDRVTSLMGGTATLFTRKGDDFIRLTTNVKLANGNRAVGTVLDAQGPASAALRQGEAYYGVVDILGRPYITAYEPVRDAGGEVIGAYYVGYLAEALDGIGEQIVAARLLERGFFALIDQRGTTLFKTKDADPDLIRAAAQRASRPGADTWSAGQWTWRAERFPEWRFTLLAAVHNNDVRQETLERVAPVFGFMVPFIGVALLLGFVFARRLSFALAQAERLREEARKLALVASRTSNGVLITGPTGRIEWVNEGFTRITGYEPDFAVGRHPDSFLMGPETSPETLAEKKRAREEKRGFQLEILNYHKSGRKVWIYADGQPVFNAEGRITNYIVVQTDITKRKEEEAELRQAREAAEDANRTKSAFLANMSHELRTPMNAIIGYSEMLIEEAEDLGQDAFVPDLKKIHSAGKHLLGLINDVLDLSKIEAGKMTLYLEDFAVPAMIGEVTATIQPLVAKNTNQLVIACPPDLGAMHADVTKIRQTLFNLLSNAAKFTHNGKVTLTVLRRTHDGREWIDFHVADTGIGMTPEQLGKLFNAFVQADASTTRKYGGTGLGLAISRKFCQLMGGDITVASEPGKGTTFTASLPAHVTEPDRSAPPFPVPAQPAAAAPSDAPLVLIVDDDATVIDLLTRNLTREGYQVRSAGNGRDALALARELQPRLITLDVMMPSMDGWSVLTALKADPAIRNIPVVMVSMVDDKQLGFTLGAADYLTKPIDRARLAEVLARHAPLDANRFALVIDDLPDNRLLLRRALEQEGWTVREAEHGRAGLDAFAAQRPGLILLDLMMPVMDGFEFLRELRARDDGRKVPVVVVTAKELTPEERDLLRTGVESIIQKGSFSHANLLEEIRARIAHPKS